MEREIKEETSLPHLTPREVVAQIADLRTQAVSNGLKLAGMGLATGIVASLTVFRRSTAPIFLGLGFGAGMGFAQGRRSLQEFYSSSQFASASPSTATAALGECSMTKKPS